MIGRRRALVADGARVAARGGFTLVEVMLALVLGGMALSGAVFLLLGLSDRGRAIDAAAWNVNHEANAERLVRNAVRNLRLSPDSTPSLEGEPTSARFRSWCDGPAGWPERCAVRLFVRETAKGRAISLETRPGDGRIDADGAPHDADGAPHGAAVVDLWSGFGSAGLRYLVDAGQGGTWTDRWSTLVPPSALGLVVDGDTLILPARR